MRKAIIEPMFESNIPGFSVMRDKVRDNYDISTLEGSYLLPVVTDRISAYDNILKEPIPFKGYVLNQLTLFWLDFLKVKNHLVTADISEYPFELQKYRDQLEGRSMIVNKFDIIPLECIVRGYLAGSSKEDYNKTGCVGWHDLPQGLVEASELPESIFTPSTKAGAGTHDENINSKKKAVDVIYKYLIRRYPGASGGWARKLFGQLKLTSLALYKQASEIAREKGIIIADTKFEFAYNTTFGSSGLVLCDEVFTPDSSRFWPLKGYKPGKPQPSLDKQFIRDYLKSIGFTGDGPVPPLPKNIIEKTTKIYIKIYEKLTSQEFRYSIT